MNKIKPKIIAIVGPTASGKTAMSIEFAKKYNGEIISADSRLVYKGFDIATAKPTIEERENIPHYLIDIVEPETDYSVGNYYDDATDAINIILDKNKTPIIVGGTGLYFRILLENYDLPRVAPNYELRETLDLKEKEALLIELKKIDPETYERLKDSNKRRIIRALEIIKTLDKPLSKINIQKEPEYQVEWHMPQINSREELYNRINKRVDVMLENGLIEETQNLLKKHGRIKNFTETIGYKEILNYLDNQVTLNEAVEKLKQHTRNYAKRQLTWFRRNPNLQINY